MKIEKNRKITKKTVVKKNNNDKSKVIVLNKIKKYEKMIHNTIVYTHKYKTMDIINSNELHIGLNNCEKIFTDLKKIKYELKNKENVDVVINKLQEINGEISNVFRLFGTKNMNDVLEICLGQKYIDNIISKQAYNIIEQLIHPINYKVLNFFYDIGISRSSWLTRQQSSRPRPYCTMRSTT